MAKVVVALVTMLALTSFAFGCKTCGYVQKHTHYPPYSKQLQEVIEVASQKTKIPLSKKDKEIINKIIWKENRPGNLTLMYNGCYGLGQGKRATYKSCGIPWKTTCPVDQVRMILIYVNKRYKTFSNAWTHHIRHNWY